MTEAQHTPGPWVHGGRTIGTQEQEGNIEPLARLVGEGPRSDEDNANIRLIAAAPDLLENIKGIVQFLDHLNSQGRLPEEIGRLYQSTGYIWQDAKAAIAKAEGR